MKNFNYVDYLEFAATSVNPDLKEAANAEIEQLNEQLENEE